MYIGGGVLAVIATANQNWGNVDDDLVQQSRLQTLPSDVGAEHDHIGRPRRFLATRTASSMSTFKNSPSTPFTTGGSAGGSFAGSRTKNGPV